MDFLVAQVARVLRQVTQPDPTVEQWDPLHFTETEPSGAGLGPPGFASLGELYDVRKLLGSGGVGAVYLAWDRKARREVAIKVLHTTERKHIDRMEREGAITAALDHPGIVNVHSAGSVDGKPYIVYERVEDCRTLEAVYPESGRDERVRMLRDQPQKFGTQTVERDGRHELWPVDPATTDSERAKWDLPTLADLERGVEER